MDDGKRVEDTEEFINQKNIVVRKKTHIITGRIKNAIGRQSEFL